MNQRTITQSLLRVLIVAAAVLALGLLINLLATGEGWSVFDFVLVEILVAGAVLVYELAGRYPGTLLSAALSAGVAALGGVAVIIGEVDDAPGLILIGAGLVLTAVWMGFRSVRLRAETPEGRTGA